MSGQRFENGPVVALVVLLVVFAGLAFAVAHAGTDDNDHVARVAASTFGIVLGPFVGALNRGGQSCCLEFAVSLLPYCLTPLVIGVGAQIVGRPRSRVARGVLWTLGWFAWFAGGIVSFGHALG